MNIRSNEPSPNFYKYLSNTLPRYLRLFGNLKSFHKNEIFDTLVSLQTFLHPHRLYLVKWYPGFVCVAGDLVLTSIGKDKEKDMKYMNQGFFPMNISSGVAAVLLEPTHSRTALDLCCCPGGKLLTILDLLPNESKVVGLDNSLHRMKTCTSLVRKYYDFLSLRTSENGNSNRCILLCEDSRYFGKKPVDQYNFIFDSDVYLLEQQERGKRKRINKSAKNRERKRLRSLIEQDTHDMSLYKNYDLVLVDAQCTHDGSYKHMENLLSDVSEFTSSSPHDQSKEQEVIPLSSPNTNNSHWLEGKRKNGLVKLQEDINTTLELQRDLIESGFRALRPGGVMVYSTCSADIKQGEDIVTWLLEQHPSEAELVTISWDPNQLFGERLVETWSEVSAMWEAVSRTESLAESQRLNHSQSTDPSDSVTNPTDTTIDSDITEEVIEGIINSHDVIKYMDTLMASEKWMSYDTYSDKDISDSNSLRVTQKICEVVSKATQPPFEQSLHLPGTLRFSYRGAVSGLYIAKIRKRETLSSNDI